MPLMKPPHYNGVKYNGADVPTDALVNVLPADVAAHLAEHWELAADLSAPVTPTVVSFESDAHRANVRRR